jgi:hypothetical protein
MAMCFGGVGNLLSLVKRGHMDDSISVDLLGARLYYCSRCCGYLVRT